jgi:alanine racemase
VNITTRELAKITGGQLKGIPDLEVKELNTDSRQAGFVAGVAFFAIRGSNHDGHKFIRSMFDRGVRIFVVEIIQFDILEFPGSAFIIVKNTIEALQLIAAYKRRNFKGSVIAVTGSTGKTIVKEWLAEIIGRSASVVRSPRSYNSQTGVPLSVWKLDETFDIGIFEAGISLPGEMAKLQNIIDPDIGIITNIGDAHQENFPDVQSKALEKLRLFINSTTIIYCSDYTIIDNLIRADGNLQKKRLVDWSFENKNSKIFVKKSVQPDGSTNLLFNFNNENIGFKIPFNDKASIENAVTVSVVCLIMGIDMNKISTGLTGLVSVAMRMEMKEGTNNCLLIEDYYNSDPGSLKMALEYLKSQNNRKSLLILSDFIQSGREEKDLYGEVARLLTIMKIDRFIGIGEALHRSMDLFREDCRFYYSTDEFIHNLQPADFNNEIILLKGARKFEFERISQLIELKVHQTVLEINMDAIAHNLNEFRRLIDPDTRIMAMVKAFAYGSGASEIAALLEYHRIDFLAVAYTDEGVELRNAGVTTPVVVMNPEASAFSSIIKYNLEPEIYSLSLLRKFTETAARYGLNQYPVHIKIDSGMHRLGFLPAEIDELLNEIKASHYLRIISVFSHLSSSEDPSFDYFTHRQVEVYLEAVKKIQEATGYSFLRHILNSSGIVRFPEYQFDMIRPGIGIYGINSIEGLNLKPAGCFKTRISQIKIVPGGEPVGYGCTDVSADDRIIAIIPVGYADGLDRKLGNRNGNLYIKNSLVPIVGNICMDMCMADVTDLGAEEGEEVEIFGIHIRVEELAEECGTIPYEILTSIPSRVKRVFYRE